MTPNDMSPEARARGEVFLLETRIKEAVDKLTTPEAKRIAIDVLKEAVRSLESELEKDEEA